MAVAVIKKSKRILTPNNDKHLSRCFLLYRLDYDFYPKRFKPMSVMPLAIHYQPTVNRVVRQTQEVAHV